MLVGIVGKDGSGKRTLARWVAGHIPQGKGNEPLEFTVEYPDKRLDKVSLVTKAEKITYYKFKFLLPGHGQKINTQLNQLRNCDAFVVIIKNFDKQDIKDPILDLKEIQDEMLLADLSVVEKRLSTLEMDKKKGKPVNEKEVLLLSKAKRLLDENRFLREDEELKDAFELKGFRFLTQRPTLVVLNNDQESISSNIEEIKLVSDIFRTNLKLELELLDLEQNEREEFALLYGIDLNSKDIFLQKLFSLLNLKTFFTFVSNEARAWAVPKGYNCLECAGAIHSDIKKGFIKAEVIPYKELERYGDFNACKRAGLLRLEGKDYMVADGDIITFRFNV